jgi:AcrR family transcriptional regulator
MARVRTRPTRQETAERLIQGAKAAFLERGFNAASVEDICAAAGLTRGAFYSGFKSKEDLFFELYDRNTLEVRRFIEQALAEGNTSGDDAGGGADDGIDAFVASLARTYPLDRDWYILNAEFTLHALRTPAVVEKLVEHRRAMRQVVAEEISIAVERAGRKLSIDAELVSRALVALTDGGLGQSLIEPEALTRSTLIEHVLGPLLTGLSEPCTPPS